MFESVLGKGLNWLFQLRVICASFEVQINSEGLLRDGGNKTLLNARNYFSIHSERKYCVKVKFQFSPRNSCFLHPRFLWKFSRFFPLGLITLGVCHCLFLLTSFRIICGIAAKDVEVSFSMFLCLSLRMTLYIHIYEAHTENK